MASSDEDLVFPFGDVEDGEVQDLPLAEHSLQAGDGDHAFPFIEIEDDEFRDLRLLEENPPSQILKELPFAQWHTDLAHVTGGYRSKPEAKDFTYEESIYTPAANTTHNFVRAYFMITHRRANARVKDEVRFIGRLPLDILIEVFKYLHPLDLYNVTLTDPSLEAYVKPPIWKVVWDSHPEIPPKPVTLSYIQWAKLWFGPAICEQCNRRVAQPDFTCSKRYCSKCLYNKIHFLYQSGEGTTAILLSCPVASRTNGYELRGYHSSGSGWRFNQDVKEVRLRLKEFDDDIARGVSDAPAAKAEYFKSKAESAKALSVHAAHCEQYIVKIFNRYKEIKKRDAMKMVEKAKKRLVNAEGFTMDGLSEFSTHLDDWWRRDMVLTINWKLIKRTWDTRIRPIALNCSHARREYNRALSFRRRKQVIGDAYGNYQKEKIKPQAWWKLPPLCLVTRQPPCQAYTSRIDDPEPKQEECVGLVQNVEEAIMGWFETWKQKIFEDFARERKLWIAQTDSQVAEEPEPEPEVEEPVLDTMNLAVSVFSCRFCDPNWYHNGIPPGNQVGLRMFGWEDVSKHMCCPDGDLEHVSFALNTSRSNVVRTILDRVGLDHQTTMGKDLDDLGYRFLCRACPHRPRGYRRWIGNFSFDWKGFVKHMTDGYYHFGFGDEPDIEDPWEVLSPEAVRYVRVRETRHPERADLSWTCNHCPIHHNGLVAYKTVVAHLKDEHNITEAEIDVDVVHLPHTYRTQLVPVVIPVAPHNLRCLICPEDKSVLRWFNEKAVLRHLHDKHGIPVREAEQNRPWKAVDMFLP